MYCAIFRIYNKTAFLSPKDPENDSIALIIDLKRVNQIFAIKHSDFSVFGCNQDVVIGIASR